MSQESGCCEEPDVSSVNLHRGEPKRWRMDDKPKNKFLNMVINGKYDFRIRFGSIWYTRACLFPSFFLGSVVWRDLVFAKSKEISKDKDEKK